MFIVRLSSQTHANLCHILSFTSEKNICWSNEIKSNRVCIRIENKIKKI